MEGLRKPLQPETANNASRRRRQQQQQTNGSPKHAGLAPVRNTCQRRLSRHVKPRTLISRTWLLPLVLILVFLLAYSLDPTESNIVHHFLFLSYQVNADDEPTQYGKRFWDIAFVGFYVIVLSFTREFIMHELLQPLARILGVKSRGKQTRFMEQMYTAVYIAFVGPLGVYCMKHTSVWYFNTRGMYEEYPHKTHDALFKFYYLFQAAFWIQQALIMILGIEERRRDFRELVIHHVVTIGLIGLSYRFHFTYMGIAVYVTHDISDFFLAVSSKSDVYHLVYRGNSTLIHLFQIAKSLNYINSPLQGVAFGLCIVIWTYLRHYINLRILYSLCTEFSTVGPYELNWDTEQYKCALSNIITFTLLAGLQTVNLYWLWCLMRNAYRFLFLGIAKDDRSEDEGPDMDVAEDRGANAVGVLVNTEKKM
jgi:very-long-chain ceramide synthase